MKHFHDVRRKWRGKGHSRPRYRLYSCSSAPVAGFCPASVPQTLKREVVEKRLQSYHGDDNQREATLKSMFEAAGCRGSNLTEQPVRGLKQPNLICVLPGSTDSIVVIGAHFDHVDAGDGVVDNWTGASFSAQPLPGPQRPAAAPYILFCGFCRRREGFSRLSFLCAQPGGPRVGEDARHDKHGHPRTGPHRSLRASRSEPALVSLLKCARHESSPDPRLTLTKSVTQTKSPSSSAKSR